MEKICDYNKCTACRACVHACPKHAITLQENEYGILLPVIDREKCVDCGLCQKVCQVNQLESMNKPSTCYAIWTKDDEDKMFCSSGGLSTGFARYVIKEGGVVFGAAYDDEFHLNIVEAHTEEDIKKFRGSKYVQCDTAESYPNVKKYLDLGKKVLYVGTPCQIMGLRKFLRKEYENLILVDIICHGVPPFKHLKEHVEYLCPKHDISKVTFRGEHDFKLTLYQNDKILYCKDRFLDNYFTAFLAGLNYRENCYSCSFAKEERGSDITIGDFWGLDKATMKQKYNGRISTLLVNTNQGEKFFDEIKNQFVYEEREVSESVNGNAQLNHATKRHEKRDIFMEVYKQEGIEKAFEKAGICDEVKMKKREQYLVRRVGRKIKKELKKIIK